MRSLLINYTGNGKGKTTAALGCAFRFSGRGGLVRVIQFIKDDSPTGERLAAAASGGRIRLESLGNGFTFRPGADRSADVKAALAAWDEALPVLSGGPEGLLILDELNVALHEGLLELAAVLDALKSRRHDLTVIVTGRNAPAELLELSDLVTEMRCVRHPFDRGISALEGIDF